MDKVRSSPKDHFMRALCRRGNPGGILDEDWLLPNIGFRGFSVPKKIPTAANTNQHNGQKGPGTCSFSVMVARIPGDCFVQDVVETAAFIDAFRRKNETRDASVIYWRGRSVQQK